MKSLFVLVMAMLIAFAAIPMIAAADPLNLPVKWSQPPNMDHGVDWLSTHQSNGPVVVDDFRSDGRPIVGFHWWGSYLDGLAPSAGTYKQFEVSFHPDVPAAPPQIPFSRPGQPYQFQGVSAQESYYGTTLGGEKVYEYWALLPVPWSEVAGNIYWVDFAYDCIAQSYRPWGWHESSMHWNDFAVTTLVPSGGNPHTGTWQLVGGGGHDMAFEVLTNVPEPSSLVALGSGCGLAGLGGLIRRRRR